MPMFNQFVYSVYDPTCAICANDQWTADYLIALWDNKEAPKGYCM